MQTACMSSGFFTICMVTKKAGGIYPMLHASKRSQENAICADNPSAG
jgi:hypothetical protein